MKQKLPSHLVALSVALAALTQWGCNPPSRETVRAGTSDPLVVIAAGLANFGGGHPAFGGGHAYVRYLIDQSTQTCWLILGDSVAPMDCCALWRVKAARPHLRWGPCPAGSDPGAPPATLAPRPASSP